MANFLHELAKNSNAWLSRVLLNSSNLHHVPFPAAPTTSSLIPCRTEPGIPVPSLGRRIDGISKLWQSHQLIFPNSTFGFFLNPVSPCGVRIPDEAEGDDAGIIRADSVKKKRKRKMNKHKYKKLRKRLRRKASWLLHATGNKISISRLSYLPFLLENTKRDAFADACCPIFVSQGMVILFQELRSVVLHEILQLNRIWN